MKALKSELILEVLKATPSVGLAELSRRIYGVDGKACIARTRQQISILRGAGHPIAYDRRSKTFSLGLSSLARERQWTFRWNAPHKNATPYKGPSARQRRLPATPRRSAYTGNDLGRETVPHFTAWPRRRGELRKVFGSGLPGRRVTSAAASSDERSATNPTPPLGASMPASFRFLRTARVSSKIRLLLAAAFGRREDFALRDRHRLAEVDPEEHLDGGYAGMAALSGAVEPRHRSDRSCAHDAARHYS